MTYTSTSTCSPDSQQHFSHSNSNIYANQSTSVPIPTPTYTEYSDIVTHVGNHPITESSKCTHALVGATFVQPANVDYKGKKSLMFVFAVSGIVVLLCYSNRIEWFLNTKDLAVKIEGLFILRYRMFDIFSKPTNESGLQIQAECYGGPFRVYSTKEFPGLHASTDLTKVNIRTILKCVDVCWDLLPATGPIRRSPEHSGNRAQTKKERGATKHEPSTQREREGAKTLYQRGSLQYRRWLKHTAIQATSRWQVEDKL